MMVARPMRSLIVCSYSAEKGCQWLGKQEGFEVAADMWCPNEFAYLFDNDGNMEILSIIEEPCAQ